MQITNRKARKMIPRKQGKLRKAKKLLAEVLQSRQRQSRRNPVIPAKLKEL